MRFAQTHLNGVSIMTKDKRALVIFLVLLVALSITFDAPLVLAGSLWAWGGWAVFLLMWAPGIAGVVACLTAYRSLKPLGLLGSRHVLIWSAICLLVPLLYTLIIHLTLHGLGVVDARWGNIGVAFFTLGLLQSAMSAFGEELGWRGFASPVFTRLFGFRNGQFALGLIWYVYHLPPLLFTAYGASPHPLFGNLMFLVSVMALSIFLGFVRQQSDSVWPSTLYHASHNLYFFSLFDPVVPKGDLAGWLLGEQGAALAGLMILAVLSLSFIAQAPARRV